MEDIKDKQLNDIGKEIRRRYIEKVKEQTEDFSRDELVKEIADLHKSRDEMHNMYESGDGYDYIGLSDDDVEELEKERFHSYKRFDIKLNH